MCKVTEPIILPWATISGCRKEPSLKPPTGNYATLLHELGHWTGHKRSPGPEYHEHLWHPGLCPGRSCGAEIASMMLGSELQIGHDPGQHVAYVDSWIKILTEKTL